MAAERNWERFRSSSPCQSERGLALPSFQQDLDVESQADPRPFRGCVQQTGASESDEPEMTLDAGERTLRNHRTLLQICLSLIRSALLTMSFEQCVILCLLNGATSGRTGAEVGHRASRAH